MGVRRRGVRGRDPGQGVGGGNEKKKIKKKNNKLFFWKKKTQCRNQKKNQKCCKDYVRGWLHGWLVWRSMTWATAHVCDGLSEIMVWCKCTRQACDYWQDQSGRGELWRQMPTPPRPQHVSLLLVAHIATWSGQHTRRVRLTQRLICLNGVRHGLLCRCRHQSSYADGGHVLVSVTFLGESNHATRSLASAIFCGVTVIVLRTRAGHRLTVRHHWVSTGEVA